MFIFMGFYPVKLKLNPKPSKVIRVDSEQETDPAFKARGDFCFTSLLQFWPVMFQIAVTLPGQIPDYGQCCDAVKPSDGLWWIESKNMKYLYPVGSFGAANRYSLA